MFSSQYHFDLFVKAVPQRYQQYWKNLVKKQSKAFAYRTVLLNEDRKFNRWYLIIRGTVKITKNAVYKQYIKNVNIGEIGQFQIVGIQDYLNDIPLYTYTVNSNHFECIRLTRKDMYIIYHSNTSMYNLNEQRKRNFYQIQFQKFVNQKKIKQQKSKERSILELKSSLNKKNSEHKNGQNIISYKSMRLNKKHQFSLPPRKSQKELQKKDPDLQKIFKENLKNIIRRKITYETKDYTLLKVVNRQKLIKRINLLSKLGAHQADLLSLNNQIPFSKNYRQSQSNSLNKYFYIPKLI